MMGIPIGPHKYIGPVRPGRGKQDEFSCHIVYGGNSGLIRVDPHHSKPIHPLFCNTFFGQYQ